MTFDDLAFGDRLFVDANPLVYYFAGDPAFGAASSWPSTSAAAGPS